MIQVRVIAALLITVRNSTGSIHYGFEVAVMFQRVKDEVATKPSRKMTNLSK